MEKASHRKQRITLILKWTLGLIGVLILIMFAIPNIFNDFITQELEKGINKHLKTELQFKESEISFFRHFPALTFSLEDVDLAGNTPFSERPLMTAKELGFGINVFKLIFSDEIEIDKTYLIDCNIILRKDKFGRNNYEVYKSMDTLPAQSESSTLGLNLNRLEIKNANVMYQDEDIGISVKSNGFNYNGKGGFDEGVFELGSKIDIDSIDVVFDKVEYLKGKTLRAKSFTVYDTKSFAIVLDDNRVSLNELDVIFNGNLNVFDEGLSYNLVFNTKNGTLQKVVTALPPKYAIWSKNTDLKGNVNATYYLMGYSGTVPDSLKRERIAMGMDIQNGEIAYKEANEKLENLNVKFKGSLENGWIDFSLDSLNFKLKEELTSGKLVLKGRGDSLYVKSNIQSKLDLTTLNQTLQLPDLKFNGILVSNWNTEGIYQPLASKFPKSKGSLKLNNGSLQTSGHPEPIKNINIDAVVQNDGNTYSESTLKINTLNFSFLENQFTVKAFFENFEQPKYQINGTGSIDFKAMHQVIDLPFLISKGTLTADVNLKGQLSNPDSDNADNGTPNTHSGTLNIKDIQLLTNTLPQPVVVKEGQFLFLNDKMAFSKLDINHGSTQMAMDGYFQNYLDYALLSKGILRGDVKLKTPYIDITEFFPKEEQLTIQPNQSSDNDLGVVEIEEAVNAVMAVPKDVDVTFQIQVDSLKYNTLNIAALSGVLGVKDQSLFLKNSNFKMVDGTASLEGYYSPINNQTALFSMDIDAEHLDIKKGYDTIELFKELVPMAEQATGQVSINYNLSGNLDQQMQPILASIEGKGVLKAENIEFNGYKLMGRISKESGFEKLNNPSVSEIEIKSSIKNNVLNYEKFNFKVSPFRLRTEGQASLDGDLNLKVRIGLPPFGLIGVPVIVTGSGEDMSVKLGRKSPDLKELETNKDSYSEQDRQRMSMLKDSIRDGMTLDQINKMQQKIENINLDSLRTQAVDTLKIKY